MTMTLYSNLPTLDLHGEPAAIAVILVKDFIRDNYNLKNKRIVIIHGIGKGIIRKTVHEELKNNIYVKEYKLDNFNVGQTIIELNL